MGVTISTPESRRRSGATARAPHAPLGHAGRLGRSRESALLAAAAAVVLFGLVLVERAVSRPFAEVEAQLAQGEVVDLSRGVSADELRPLLAFVPDPGLRRLIAEEVARAVAGDPAANVGELAKIRLPAAAVRSEARLAPLRERLAAGGGESVPLLTREQFQRLKPRLVARAPGRFRAMFWRWSALLLAGFAAVHLVWLVRGFRGDPVVLPVLLALTGLGLMLMASLRDPLRDLPLFATFGQGVLAGCALLLGASLLDLERSPARRLTFLPLAAALGLSVLLILFGSGPGTSDAKVNLLGFQPVELIKILVVLFLAGWFVERWEFLRELTERRLPLPGWLALPKLEYAVPPVIALAVVLFFFFLQRDLGPALILSFLFLLLYSVARGRVRMLLVGTALVVVAFAVGYRIGYPRTVTGRIGMWLSPWDNTVRGGDHLAEATWALASGGLSGAGPGLGQPGRVPEAHTDMVLAAVGEELGFLGLVAVLALYAVLVARCLRATLRAPGVYSFFLGLGLALLIALQIALITGGVLGLVPLSGVVSPFLSSGRTAMLANFFIVGLLLSISAHPGDPAATRRFRAPVRWIALGLGAVASVALAKVVWVQMLAADEVATRGALTLQADGRRRFRYNGRLADLADGIPRGTIVDRNGIPLATSDPEALAEHRAALASLGAELPEGRDAAGRRVYPFNGRTFHLLGDLTNRANWGAPNTTYAERDERVRLQGYDDYAEVVDVRQPDGGTTREIRRDYRELLPLLRHEPDHPAVRAVLGRDRTLSLSIDARLQLRLADAVERAAQTAGHGAAAVVLDARTGEILANVSYPWPEELPVDPAEHEAEVIDRARYGIYPPGSTFKIVTAMAALREDSDLAEKTYECRPLPDGRVGNRVRGWGRPIRDDPTVRAPHGTIAMEGAIARSCNAYFAQLATYEVEARPLLETAGLLGIEVARPNTPDRLEDALPQAAYGQGQVVATPAQMARVAATVAAGGTMPEVRWTLVEQGAGAPRERERPEAPEIVGEGAARVLARAMRGVVAVGTAAPLLGQVLPPVAGKTGTAEVQGKPSHSWFIGFAPYGAPPEKRTIAFAVVVEHGGYGGRAAAPVAGEIVRDAAALGLIE